METIEVKLYTFEELSEDAQERAIEKERESRYRDVDVPWWDETKDTLNAFCERFYVEWNDYGRYNSNFGAKRVRLDNYEGLSGLRLRTYLVNNFSDVLWKRKRYGEYRSKNRTSRIVYEETDCPFTGYGMDYTILQPIRDFIAKPTARTDYECLMNDCLSELSKAWNDEVEHWYSDEAIREDLLERDHLYDEDGDLWR
jgi:hypothetical protein